MFESIFIVIGIVVGLLLLRHFRIHLYAFMTGFPRPKYRVVVTRDVKVAMTDGIKLATDIYLPKAVGKYPVIVIRTPYDKSGYSHPYKQLGELFAGQGYVFIVQDVRGKFGSEGGFFPYKYEGLDGHTTVTWAGQASWSDGNVALCGFSYIGSCAWLGAKYQNQYLRTIIPMFTTQNTQAIWVENGIPFLKGPLFLLSKFSERRKDHKITFKTLEPHLWQLPVKELDVEVVHHKIPFYREYLSHITPDLFWEQIGVHKCADQLNVPAFIIGGWYDPFLRGTIEDYQRMMRAPPGSLNLQSRLQIGPWAHNPTHKFQGLNFENDVSYKSILQATLKWCDRWLKNAEPTTATSNLINYYLMGKHIWKETKEWPPKNISYAKHFLSKGEGFDTNSKGLLTLTHVKEKQKNSYFYNPKDPIKFKSDFLHRSDGWIGPINQEEIILREDSLIYTSPVLLEELIVVGPPKLLLYVSSEAVDTDFCVKLCDIHPNGKSYTLTWGFIRMRFRESLETPKMMVPGEIYRVEIALRSVANAFLKNHRVQLQISSADFPTHDRNLNTGKDCETTVDTKIVQQTIYTGGGRDSALILPLLNE